MKQKNQIGQSLIETIIAIFILTMALTTALGLAVYALSSAAVSQNSIIASNLAREGVEAIRMMRDSNWLAGEASADTSYNLTACGDLGSKLCYNKVFTGPTYNFTNFPYGDNYRVKLNTASNTWSVDNSNAYDLYLQSDGTYSNNVTTTASIYSRKVVVSLNSGAGFTVQNPQIRVQSIVGWRAKNCTAMSGSDPSTTNCKIVVEEYLNNWKDY